MNGDHPAVPAVPLAKARERAVEVLCKHFASDDLPEEEFEARLDRTYAAVSLQQLREVVADLPGGVEALSTVPESRATPLRRAPPDSVRERGLQLAVLGGSERHGAWIPPRHMYSVAAMGGACLDFREALLAPGVTVVTAIALMGGIEIIVPPGVTVQTHGLALMGGFEALDQAADPSDPGAPVIRINGLACMGGVEVKQMLPGETDRDARRRRKEERRRLRMERRRRLGGGKRE